MGRPRKAAERAIALGDDDPDDYALAADLHLTLGQLDAMPHDEYVRWKAYRKWRGAMRRHAADVQTMRAGYR